MKNQIKNNFDKKKQKKNIMFKSQFPIELNKRPKDRLLMSMKFDNQKRMKGSSHHNGLNEQKNFIIYEETNPKSSRNQFMNNSPKLSHQSSKFI
jgi:hypothetical protein